MADYKVDRALLESFSTEEIIKILNEQMDDYTPEAIKIFQRILEERGVSGAESTHQADAQDRTSFKAVRPQLSDIHISNPGDALRMLNSLLSGVLDGSMDPQVAQVAGNLVMGILKAQEQEYMQGSGEE